MFTHTVTPTDLATRLGRSGTTSPDAEVQHCLDVAVALLTDATEAAFREIPEAVCNDMVIRVARSVWENAKRQHGGVATTQLGGETAVRTPRDPLAVVKPYLARYVVPL